MKKIAFVAPWYGKDIPGGAEMEMRSIISHLQGAGMEIEVLTTCVREFASDWYANYHKPGCTIEEGASIRRFKVRKGDGGLFSRINCKLLKGVPITDEEEEAFLKNIVSSDDLCKYIKEHYDEYALFLFIPYMFGTTYYGAMQCLNKAVLIPCLHDEGYAYFSRFRRCFSQVNGLIYNAEPERTLANRLYCLEQTNQITMGIGMDINIAGNAERFRDTYDIQKPFILYAGRKDRTKNVDTLLDYFTKYKQEYENDLQLVMIGPESLPIPASVAESVHDLGFVSLQDKYDAYAAAYVLCQPSKHESFSFVIMESWLMGRPVMVHEDCKVTSNFTVEANGGFYFKNYGEFVEEVNYLLVNPNIADIMGQQGRDYVCTHFSWDIIVEKYKGFLETCVMQAEGSQQ